MDTPVEKKKVMLSGIKPTGDLTLGSYLGAIKNWAERAEQYDCYYFMADLHALTTRNNPADLRRRTLEQLAQYVACGLDPQKNTLFIQSHVPQHAELGWILNCYTMFGELSRMTQFKDKSAKNADNINGGLFTYPALMAADILLYQPDYVPVGEDQKQHVELTRDVAQRFNNLYGETFRMPEPFIPKVGARVMDLLDPHSKMSKSDEIGNGRVCLMDDPADIMRKFKRAVTDCDTERCVRYDPENKPGVANLMQIYSACTGKTPQEVEKEFDGKGYGDFKMAVGEAVIAQLAPMQEKYQEIVDFSELKNFMDVPVKNYSSGMKSRLGFAIATVVSPKILILDEVLSVGDAKFRKKSENKILSMFDSGVTVLFVSHSLEQVKRLCNKAIILEKGKVVSYGDIDTISAQYEQMIGG